MLHIRSQWGHIPENAVYPQIWAISGDMAHICELRPISPDMAHIPGYEPYLQIQPISADNGAYPQIRPIFTDMAYISRYEPCLGAMSCVSRYGSYPEGIGCVGEEEGSAEDVPGEEAWRLLQEVREV